MPMITVRVELVQKPKTKTNASAEDYLAVREALAGAGLLHTVKSSNGTVYELPPAEYRGERAESPSEVVDLVRSLVNAIWVPNRVFVTQGPSSWNGLEVIPPESNKK